MRKMTKTAAVLAAMSAMTVASASMAFAAAKEVTNVKAESDSQETVAAGESVGKWSKTADGWKFAIDGKNLKDTWAEIDGVWYYFNGELMAQEDFLYIDDKGYYFDQNGTMATGWQKITSDTDAYGKIEISTQLQDKYKKAYEGTSWAYDYYDYVWCYFDEHGEAMEDEWFKDVTNLHYYFDGHVMVMDIMDYVIDPDNYDLAQSNSYELYGFDKNGAMLTGWNELVRKNDDWNGPTQDTNNNKTYYYYDMDGTMQKTGWRKIDGTWYLFANYVPNHATDLEDHVATNAQYFGYPVIMNSYVTSNKNTAKSEYFYLDKDGKMVTGVATVPKDAWRVTFYTVSGDNDTISISYEDSTILAQTTAAVEAYFGTKGAADGDKVVDNKYYVKQGSYTDVVGVTASGVSRVTASVEDYSAAITAVTGSGVWRVTGTRFDAYGQKLEAALVKSAFVGVDSETLYLADAKGNLVKNKAILISNAAGIVQGSTKYENAFILFSNSGKAYTGYEGTEKSVSIGGVKYWATDETVEVGDATVTVFVSSKLK